MHIPVELEKLTSKVLLMSNIFVMGQGMGLHSYG